METPYYVISQKELDENINAFKNALLSLWPNSILSYSVKTNSLPWVLKYCRKSGMFAEVVSDEEYLLALECGYNDNEIVFNGPKKSENLFNRAVLGGAKINIDSKSDIEHLKKNASQIREIGIRINVPPNEFCAEDIHYKEEGFRFGFCAENGELEKVIDIIKENCDCKIGLHMHCNSATREKSVFAAIAHYAKKIILKYNIDVSYIDIGGGFFGGVLGRTTPFDYIEAIKNELEEIVDISKTKLIVEPGSAIISSTVRLYSSVVDIKDTTLSRIVTTDTSRLHIDPTWCKTNYIYSLETDSKSTVKKQILCGYTCMDSDRIMTLKDEKELKVDDKIVFYRVGGYSMTFGGMFIRYYPDVYVDNGKTMEKIRKRITTKEYYDIQS